MYRAATVLGGFSMTPRIRE